MSKTKIKILDNEALRQQIDDVYENQEKVTLARWALEIAKHIIHITNINIEKYPEITEGFRTNELWQNKQARMFDVRQIGFKIHEIARQQNNELKKNIFRVIGQAVSSGHMKEHSIVASDYAVKVINILYNNDLQKVVEERKWQLNKLLTLST